MQSERRDAYAPAWLIALCLLAMLLGIALRFSFLDTKALFGDEAVSSLNAAGYSVQQYKLAVDPHKPVTSQQLFHRFQDAAASPDFGSTIYALAKFDPAHPPVYFVTLHFWELLFGDSVPARRSLAALFGSLALFGMFWLCRELSRSAAAAWIGMAIAALSPFNIVYAQQIREYSLFALMCLVTGALLLRAFRLRSAGAWSVYALSMLAALYVALLSVFVLVAFCIYAVIRERRFDRNLKLFTIATAAAFALYVPWLVEIKTGWQSVLSQNNYFALPLTPKLYLAKLVFAAGSVFFDAEYANVRFAVGLAIAGIVAAYALVAFFRTASAEARVFLISLIAVNAVAIVGGDIVTHSGHIKGARYLYPAFLGLEAAVAMGLAAYRSFAARLALCVLLAVEFVSCVVALRHVSWWANNDGAPILQASRYVDGDRNPLVVTDRWTALVMSNSLKNDALFAFDPRSAVGLVPGRVVYYYAPPKRVADVRLLARTARVSPTRLDTGIRGTATDATSASGYVLWRFAP